MSKRISSIALATTLAIAGCSGSAGSDGAPGANGKNGVSPSSGPLSLTLDSVATSGGTSTLTFTVRPAGAVCPSGVCDPSLSGAVIGKKSFSAQEYNATTKTFDTAKNFSYGGITFVGLTADGQGAQYKATAASAPFAPEQSAHAFVYAYVTGLAAAPAPSTGHYYLPSSVASAAKVFGTIPWTSKANASGCERCHGAPYAKHGYRVAAVPGLPDFAACKVCHTDQRPGEDGAWYTFADDPANYDPNNWDPKYAYTANIMNDVHNSHAFEFNYPQSMANCVTCHANQIASLLVQANFKPSVCKSCHPVNGYAGTQAERAPSFASLWSSSNPNSGPHSGWDPSVLYTTRIADNACNGCHTDASGFGFADLHKGFNAQIYADAASANAGTKFSDSRKAVVDSASFDGPSYVVTVAFHVAGVPTSGSVVVPTVVASLYGYGTKDFLVSGHGKTVDSARNLEASFGANTSRVIIAQGADSASFVATLKLSAWASLIPSQVNRIEVGLLPEVGVDPTLAVSTSNPISGVTGATATVSVAATAANALVADAASYGKAIVDGKKCQVCHDQLSVYVHGDSPEASAPTVGCRLCHAVVSAAGHLELQSRSIDSYLHGIHSMQFLGANTANLTDPVQSVRYGKWVEGVYPNFAGPLNCESCHAAGTYDAPGEDKSLPSLLSGMAPVPGRTGLGTIGQKIVGPSARACGACHRAMLVNEADGAKLAAFEAHTDEFGSSVIDATALSSTAAYLQYMVGASPTAVAAPAGAGPEQCAICHATSGSEHQSLFNSWKQGL